MATEGSIGNLKFRLDPESVAWNFSVKTKVTDTLGGKVIQVFGVKLGEMTLSGSFGKGGIVEQAKFMDTITKMANAQSKGDLVPHRFLLPSRKWDFQVYVRGMTTPDGDGAVYADPSIFNPQWTLRLFIVEENAGLKKVATDDYISRLSDGIGWTPGPFNGPPTQADATAAMAAVDAKEGTGGGGAAGSGGSTGTGGTGSTGAGGAQSSTTSGDNNHADRRGWGSGWPSCQANKMARFSFSNGKSIQCRAEIGPLVVWLVNETLRRGYEIRDIGSFACRPIRGYASTPSNHSWGLAIDINPTQNPMKTGPLTTDMPQWMVDLWKSHGFGWGGDYKNRKDAMHYEVSGTPEDIARITAAL